MRKPVAILSVVLAIIGGIFIVYVIAPQRQGQPIGFGPEDTAETLPLGKSGTIREVVQGGIQFGNDNISYTVVQYDFSDSPAEWSAFLWVYVTAKNIGEFPEHVHPLDLFYRGNTILTKLHIPSNFRGESRELFGYPHMKPGKHHEGWLIFEVPKSIDISEVKVGLDSMLGTILKPYWTLEP